MGIIPTKSSFSHSVSPPSPGLCEKAISGLGYVWKTMIYLPVQLYDLIKRISETVISRFHAIPAVPPKSVSSTVKIDIPPVSPAPSLFKSHVAKKEVEEKIVVEEEILDLQDLFKTEEEKLPAAHDPLPEESKQQILEPQVKKDPLVSPVPPQPEIAVQVVDLHVPIKEAKDAEQKEKLSLGFAQDTVKSAQELLKEAQTRSCSLDTYMKLTLGINREFDLLIAYSKTVEKENPQAFQLVQETIQALQAKMAELGKEIVQPAANALTDVDEAGPEELKDYLDLTDRVDQEFQVLQQFASIFEKTSPECHRSVQSMIKALEQKKTSVDEEMCAKVRKQFKPNPKTPGDGSCLFWSIDEQMKTRLGARHYRKMAADYIRNHPLDFESDITDVMDQKGEPKRKFDLYTKAQGGKKAWEEKLEKKLKKKPTDVDLYTDCLQNSTLWGGENELGALSEVLEATIIVFTPQNAASWRVDLMIGRTKYPDKICIIHYDGSIHYQSLIKK